MSKMLYDFPDVQSPHRRVCPRVGSGSGALGRNLVYGIDASSPAPQARYASHVIVWMEPTAEENSNRRDFSLDHIVEDSARWQSLRQVVPEIVYRQLLKKALPMISSSTRDLDEITTTFSLNITQAAAVFGTSRQTIHGWRKGQPVRRLDLKSRIIDLHSLVIEWSRLSKLPIGDGLLYRNPITQRTLLELLQQSPIDVNAAQTHLRQLSQYLDASWSAADALIARNKADRWAPLSAELREETIRGLTQGDSRS